MATGLCSFHDIFPNIYRCNNFPKLSKNVKKTEEILPTAQNSKMHPKQQRHCRNSQKLGPFVKRGEMCFHLNFIEPCLWILEFPH